MSPAESKVVVLPDGARLGYASYGHPEGRPLLFFHGWPGSRLQGRLAHAAALRLDWHLVAVDRPGIGLSRVPEPLALPRWAARIAQFLDGVGWERCHLLAISGGAPSALACMEAIPERLHGVGIACGATSVAEAPSLNGLFPLFRLLLSMDRAVPAISPVLLQAMKAYLALLPPAASMQPNRLLLRGVDRRLFRDREVRRSLALSLREAYRQGPQGVLRDGRAIAEPWGFDWRNAGRKTPVRFWHGDADGTIPLNLARWAVREMDLEAHLEVLPREGHFSLPIAHAQKLLRDLAELTPL